MITIKLSNYSTRKEYVHQLLNSSQERSIGRKLAMISASTMIPFIVVAYFAKELGNVEEIEAIIKKHVEYTRMEAE